jgi:hypothetical protein
MKFKIGDRVKPLPEQYGKRFQGIIWDCPKNTPEKIRIEDGEPVYVVEHYNYRGKMVMTYHIKESDLILDLAPQK